MKKVDILIKNGRVIDCYNNIDKIKDIAINNGKIVDTADVTEAEQTIDATGCIVTPGLIDYHCHVAYRVSELSIFPESTYLPSGVTTVVDAGSTGVANYESFRYLSMNSPLRIKAYLNVCSAGLATASYLEDIDPKKYNVKKIKRYLEQYSDQLLGLKIRQTDDIANGLGLEPMKEMIELADEIGCPVVVHTTKPPTEVGEIAKLLRKGDVYAHVFQGKKHTIIGADGKVVPEIWEAKERGVIFDCANGFNHTCHEVAEAAIAEGFLPDIISTDLSIKNWLRKSMVFTLPFVMSRYVAFGLTIPQIIERVTTIPARHMGMEKELGSLSIGTVADVAVQRMVKNSKVYFEDFNREKLNSKEIFRTEMTVCSGQIMYRDIEF